MKHLKINYGTAFLFFPFVAILVALILLSACSSVKKAVSKSSFGYSLQSEEVKDVKGLRKYDLSNTVSKDSTFENSVTIEESFSTDSVPKLINRKTTTTSKGKNVSSVAATTSRYDSGSVSVKSKIDSTGYFKSSVKNVKKSGVSFTLYISVALLLSAFVIFKTYFNGIYSKVYLFLKNQLNKI